MRRGYEKIPLLMSLVFNTVSVLLKYSVYTSTMSRAVLAEMFHSIGDTINSLTLYQGATIYGRPPTIRYPFGRGRFAYVISLISSVLLTGSVFYMIAVEGVLRPVGGIETSTWRAYVPYLAVVIVFDVTTLVISLYLLEKVSPGGRVLLKPLVLEDLMGLSGNVLAIASLYIAEPGIDTIVSVVIAVIILASTVHMVYENIGILVGVSAPRELLWRIVRSVISIPEVVDVNDVKSLTIEPGEYIVILQVEIDPSLDLEEVMRVKEEITRTINRIDPSVRYVIIDIVRPQEPPGTFERILREIRELRE